MSAQEAGRTVAEMLIDAGAVHVSTDRPFFLAAGWASPVYVDVRLLFGAAATRRVVTDLAADFLAGPLAGHGFDAIAGAETAGMPFATTLADRLDMELRHVRKRPLGAGHNAQVEGGPVDGRRVLLLDDLTTDGSSKLSFARGLRSAGAVVTDVLTIFYHDAFPGTRERLANAGLCLHSLATWQDVLALKSNLPAPHRAVVEEFLADPVVWSARHGGRADRPAG
ncbi:orotate phosphoribosyltransferase [Paracoccus sp. NGMCC 1.201697]|uniref:Orotate phosphoribosyltransferase n=1 Tax=Paracoccus broussonetiae subsp. drimophilus TaxID=3373869 RepID=A0ABW7LQ07_9RHOB